MLHCGVHLRHSPDCGMSKAAVDHTTERRIRHYVRTFAQRVTDVALQRWLLDPLSAVCPTLHTGSSVQLLEGRCGAAQAVVHRLPDRSDRRAFQNDAFVAALIEPAQQGVEVPRVFARIGGTLHPGYP